MSDQSIVWQEEVLARLQAGQISIDQAERLLQQGNNSSAIPNTIQPTDIAIIGMACRFPGANDWRALWENLRHGVDSIRNVPAGRWSPEEEWYHPDPTHPNTAYIRCGGFLESVDCFDAPFFRIQSSEADVMDPQQRIFLEESYHAIEDAGYAPEKFKGQNCGVFVGAAQSDYATILTDTGMLTSRLAVTAIDSSIIAARIAYFLDLRGVAIAINAACASSLVAIHHACENIRSGAIDLALAGGISLSLTPTAYIPLSQVGLLSPEGRCKTFDATANGFVPGEGCGVLLLKKADKALADGDHIYAIIKGSAINQNGSTNGITAPSRNAQIRLEKNLYEKLGINPATIGYVEAHGTGTRLGDAIEIEALTETFSAFTTQSRTRSVPQGKQFCAIGSIKTNIGHTLLASGVASVIKTALCLKYGELVPSLHFDQPNPEIDFANTPFYVCTSGKAWQATDARPRRAAVSAFGLNGTNVHMVLESAPELANKRDARPYHLLTISATSDETLREYAQRYQSFLAAQPSVDLGDLCYTAHTGRSHFAHRLSIVADSIAMLQSQLADYVATGIRQETIVAHQPRPKSDRQEMLESLGALYTQGVKIDWAGFARDDAYRRVSLPTYPFQRQRHWACPEPGRRADAPRQVQAIRVQDSTQPAAPLTMPGLREQLQTLDGVERRDLLERYLLAEIIQMLNLPADAQIEKDDNWFNLGFDSLMAVELKNRIQTTLGCTLPSTLLFDYTTLEALTSHLDEITRNGQTETTIVPLVKADRTKPLPLSLAQQRLWFNQTSNRANSYNIIVPLRLEGKLDVAVLEQTLTALLERHQVLRTVFPTVDGTAVQVITEPQPIKLAPIDLQNLGKAKQATAIQELIQKEIQHIYDLDRALLWRVVLARLGAEQHFLLFSFNHILIDAESLAQILDEMSLLYDAFKKGAASPLPPLVFQYADYTAWQHQTLTPEIIASRVQYWVQRLSGNAPLFELDSDKPRPARETFRGDALSFQFSQTQLERLQALQKTSGATLFNTLLAAWSALLYRYGNGKELVIGAPFANRTHQEMTGVVGHWASMLILPMRFQDNPTFLALIQQATHATLQAMSNDVPIDQLVQQLPPARKRNNLPHQFLMRYTPGNVNINIHLDGVAVTSLENKNSTLRPDLCLTIMEEKHPAGSRLTCDWEYKVELFEEGTIRRMMDDFHSLLNVMLADPNCPIENVTLPNLEERVKLRNNG